MKLTKEQQIITESLVGNYSVISGPGSGKTETMVQRINNILKTGVDPKKICVITYSKRAADSLEERLSSLIGTDDASEMFIGTIHAFCFRLIQAFNNRPLRVIHTRYELRTIIYENTLDKLAEQGIARAEAEEQAATLSDRILSDFIVIEEALSETQSNKPLTQREREKLLRVTETFAREDIITFSLMLHQFLANMQNPIFADAVRKRFSFLIIDEFQDTSLIQNNIIDSICIDGQANLCVVGDVDQAIYEWRGASPEFMLKLPERYKDMKVLQNSTCFRYGEVIRNVTQSLISNNRNRFPLVVQLPPNCKKKSEFIVREYFHRYDMLDAVAYEASKYYEENPDKTIAILSEYNSILKDVCRRLPLYGAKFRTLYFDISSDPIIAAGAAMLGLATNSGINTRNTTVFLNMLKKSGTGIGESTAERLLAYSTSRGANILLLFRDSQHNSALASILSTTAWESTARLRLLLSQITNSNQLKSIEHGIYNVLKYIYGENDVWDRPYAKLIEDIQVVASMSYSNIEKREIAESGIYTLTIHAAKGLEFDKIIIPVSTMTHKCMEEERRRVMYVGTTRAKESVSVCFSSHEFDRRLKCYTPKARKPWLLKELTDHPDCKYFSYKMITPSEYANRKIESLPKGREIKHHSKLTKRKQQESQ